MPRYDFTTQRLWVTQDLSVGQVLPLERAQANYLLNVLRMGAGDAVLVFNGRDGEWCAEVRPTGRKAAVLEVVSRTREQPDTLPPLRLLFAPLKRERLDYLTQKAVEMGAGLLQPVMTQHTQGRFNTERARANAIEAAEQCGILSVPQVAEPVTLDGVLDGWADVPLIFCDEGEATQNPLVALGPLRADRPRGSTDPLAVLIGPEGGFSESERNRLRAMPCVVPIPLGPRVLRADTAAVAALAVVQAALGDWS